MSEHVDRAREIARRNSGTGIDTAAVEAFDPAARSAAIVRFHQEQGDGKAKHFLSTAKRCAVCGGCMAYHGGRDRHFLCEPNSIIGRRCVCSGRCSTDNYGDQGSCADGCEVCGIMRGQPLRESTKRRK